MDAMDFIRVSVSSLALRFNEAEEAASSSYFCKIKLHDFPIQTAVIPVLNPKTIPNPNPNPNPNTYSCPDPNSNSNNNSNPNPSPSPNLIHQTSRTNSRTYHRIGGSEDEQSYFSNSIRANFYLDKPALSKLLHHNLHCFGAYSASSSSSSSFAYLEIVVFSGSQIRRRRGKREEGESKVRQIGSLKLRICQEWSEGRVRSLEVFHGWTSINGKKKTECNSSKTNNVELHLLVKVEPDPRFLFCFDGDPVLSSQIVQTLGNCKQPIFSCKFSRDRSSRSGLEDAFKGWAISSNREKEKEKKKERKGWLVMIHDLSGSPVAAASMVTPFVPSAGSNHVSRSNPGAWLILRSDPGGVSSWCPWGRLEAWREQGLIKGGVGFRFQLVPEGGGININSISDGILISETVINTNKGGEFSIDTSKACPTLLSPTGSPQSSGDFAFNMAVCGLDGFVMSCSVGGKGGRSYSKNRMKPEVQVAVRHLSSVEDSAVFMALAAAIDLSIDACQSFTRKLRKEFSD